MKTLPFLMALVAFASTAYAQEAETLHHEVPQLAVSSTFGLATPLGEAGLELEADMTRWFSLSAGVGLGASGPQLAAMARAGIPTSNRGKLYAGAGLSRGRWVWTEFVFDDEAAIKTWQHADWVNGELGVEHTIFGSSVWSGRVFGGFSKLINQGDYMCNNEHCAAAHQDDGERLIYAGFAVTRALSM